MTTRTRGAALLEALINPKTHTQASVAREVGVSPEAVRHWLTDVKTRGGYSRPRPDVREKLEREFGIPASSWEEPEEGEPADGKAA